jgi:hypothetical protein
MILDLQSRLAQLVRTAAREAFNVDLEAIAFPRSNWATLP